jgi:hypothetical protein
MPKAYPTMTEEDEKWKAEDDARTLSSAEEIKADEKRLEKAQKAADRLRKEKEEEAKNLEKIATGKVAYPSMSIRPDKED